MQVDRSFLPWIDRRVYVRVIQASPWLRKSTEIGFKTWNDFLDVDEAILWHKIYQGVKASELLEFKDEHRPALPILLSCVRLNRTIHYWGTFLNNDWSGSFWKFEDAGNSEAGRSSLSFVIFVFYQHDFDDNSRASRFERSMDEEEIFVNRIKCDTISRLNELFKFWDTGSSIKALVSSILLIAV